MSYNKTLGVAIAAILSGGIGLAAQAAELTFDDAATQFVEKDDPQPVEIAFEEVDNDGGSPAVLPAADLIYTRFEFKNDANIIYNVYIDYTLTGAVFNTAVANPTWKSLDNNTNTPAITRINAGGIGDSTVRFLLQAGKTNIRTDKTIGNAFAVDAEEDVLDFGFNIKEVEGLATSGGTVKFSAAWGAADIVFTAKGTDTVTIYKSKPGVSVDINAISTAEIDVTENSKKFVSGVDGSTTAITLGTILIVDDGTFTITAAGNKSATGTLIVKDGPFSASTGNQQVFLEFVGSDCKFDDDGDAGDLAATVDGVEATFELNEDAVFKMAAGNHINVCVVIDDDNTTDIDEPKDKATAVLTLEYNGSKKEQNYPGSLAKIERNGTACTIYNVPHKQASDRGFYRFINKTTADSTVWASIKDREAVVHLVDQELGTVVGNGTLVVNSDQLHDYAIAQGAADVKPWKGRAILTINSDSTNMEVYGLLKGKNTQDVLLPKGATTPPIYVGPLVNISNGASGNGCD